MGSKAKTLPEKILKARDEGKYMKIRKNADGSFAQPTYVVITGHNAAWKADPDFVYSPDLRLAGNRHDIVEWLNANDQGDVSGFLNTAYSLTNYTSPSAQEIAYPNKDPTSEADTWLALPGTSSYAANFKAEIDAQKAKSGRESKDGKTGADYFELAALAAAISEKGSDGKVSRGKGGRGGSSRDPVKRLEEIHAAGKALRVTATEANGTKSQQVASAPQGAKRLSTDKSNPLWSAFYTTPGVSNVVPPGVRNYLAYYYANTSGVNIDEQIAAIRAANSSSLGPKPTSPLRTGTAPASRPQPKVAAPRPTVAKAPASPPRAVAPKPASLPAPKVAARAGPRALPPRQS